MAAPGYKLNKDGKVLLFIAAVDYWSDIWSGCCYDTGIQKWKKSISKQRCVWGYSIYLLILGELW